MTSTKRQRKVKYFDLFFNQKDFFSTDISPDLFNSQPVDLDWYYAKLLLRHKSCTHEFRMRYINSTTWYERLVACLAKPARAQYAVYAMKDKDSRVLRAVFHGSLPEEVVTSPDAAYCVWEYWNKLPPTRLGGLDDLLTYSRRFIKEYEASLQTPSLGLLSPNEDIRRITKERLDVLSKMQR